MKTKIYSVGASVEVDPNWREARYFLVIAKNGFAAESTLKRAFLDNHPHDLCKPGRAHVGLDRVRRGSARVFLDLTKVTENPVVLGNAWEGFQDRPKL